MLCDLKKKNISESVFIFLLIFSILFYFQGLGFLYSAGFIFNSSQARVRCLVYSSCFTYDFFVNVFYLTRVLNIL